MNASTSAPRSCESGRPGRRWRYQVSMRRASRNTPSRERGCSPRTSRMCASNAESSESSGSAGGSARVATCRVGNGGWGTTSGDRSSSAPAVSGSPMDRSSVEELPLYPEERKCKRPTTEQVLRLFSFSERHVLERNGKLVQVFGLRAGVDGSPAPGPGAPRRARVEVQARLMSPAGLRGAIRCTESTG